MAKKEKKSNWGFIIGILIFLFVVAYIFSSIISLMLGSSEIREGNVALIPVKGIITTESSGDFFSSGVANSGQIVMDIEDASQNPDIQAIILEIDSPGGAPVATDEIATAIRSANSANKTTVAWIREVGASGGYWIASACEHVVANKMSITGSIGVFGSYLDFSGFLADWNISYEQLTAGKYKDTGVPFRKLTEEERKLLQKKLDLMHQMFKDEVQKNRGLTNSEIENVGKGEFYIGTEAMDLKLIDQLGGRKEAVAYIEKKLDIEADIASYEHEQTFLEALLGVISNKNFFLGNNLPGTGNSRVGMLS